jgi:hypothetical protein
MNKITNLKIYKRFLSLVSAIIMMATPVSVLAEGNKDDNNNVLPIEDIYDEEKPIQLTYDEYLDEVEEIIKLMEPFAKNRYELQDDVYRVYYYPNHKNCVEIRQQLIDQGEIHENLEDGEMEIMELVPEFAYINSNILKKSTDINKMFDISVFIKDSKIRNLSHDAFVNLIKTYEKGTIDCEEYGTFIKQLEELKEKDYFISYTFLYNMLFTLYEHCVFVNYPQKEIKEYFAIKGSTLGDINKKNYKSSDAMYNELIKKDQRSGLEEYIILIFDNQPYTYNRDDFLAAVEKINAYYNESIEGVLIK